MPEPTKFSNGSPESSDPMFQDPGPPKSFPTAAVAIAAIIILIIAVGWMEILGRHYKVAQGGASYSANLSLTNLQMSQLESLSGGKSTYLDGHITNNGKLTVTAVTVKAEFGTGGTPQALTAPVAIIRTRQPYVDTEPLSAAPLPPGGQADFRLIFEGVSDSWDQKMPTLQIIETATQ